MNTISSSSSYTASSAKGISGLASGMDTDSMVESMLSGTQGKIDKAKGDKQVWEWKQDIYRGFVNDINAFQSKFFDLLSDNCMISNSFYNLMNAVSSSNSVKATANSGAATGSTTIKVGQLATSAKAASAQSVSNSLEGRKAMDIAALQKREVTLLVNGSDVTIDLSTVNENTTDTELQGIFDTALTGKGVTATVVDGRLSLEGSETDTIKVSDKSSAWGLAMTGLSAYAGSYKGKMSSTTDVEAKPSIEITLNKIKKSITLDPSKLDPTDPTQASFVEDINKQLTRAFGRNVGASIDSITGKIKFEPKKSDGTTDNSQEIVIYGDTNLLKALGGEKFESGTSNKVSIGQTLGKTNFKTELKGDSYKFSINGTDFEFDENTTINKMITTINNSDAGVKLTYSDLEDKFKIESSATGSGYGIEMEQNSGNLLNVLFGAKFEQGELESSVINKGSITSNNNVAADSVFEKGGEFRINVDGKNYVITVPSKDPTTDDPNPKYTTQQVVDEINRQLGLKLGSDKVRLSLDTNSTTGVTKTNLVTTGKTTVKFSKIDVNDTKAANLAKELGFTIQDGSTKGQTTAVSADEAASVNLSDVGIEPPTGSSITTLQQLIDASGGALSMNRDGRLVVDDSKVNADGTLVGVTDPDVQTMLQTFYGVDNLKGLPVAPGAGLAVSDGTNAIVEINGIETERTSNIFTVNGIQLDLKDSKATKNPDGTIDWGTAETVKIETSRDTDKIVDTIKSFVEDYNKLIEKVNKTVKEDADFRKYPPLTDAQKKEMSESEITAWEKKSKTGLLRNDSDLNIFLSSIRTSMYSKPAGSTLGIWDIGIDTTDKTEEAGKLSLDVNKLKQMLQSNPTDIQNLFSNGVDGILENVNNAMKSTANKSSASPGTLVSLAGVAGLASDKSNTIYTRMKELDDKITRLKNTYDKQKTRYWRQFTSMEKMVSQMGSQSSWLSQQFSM